MRFAFYLSTLRSLGSAGLDLLAPPRKTERAVRALSMDNLLTLAAPDGTLPYGDPRVTSLVWELKYRGNARAAALAGEYLSDLLLAEASECIGKPLLIPMPMHAARRRERGYNQTELLCQSAMKLVSSSFDYAPRALERVRNTAPQQGLARQRRLTNVKNSMHATDPALIRGRVCIVVDDVSTTGASFAEARRALMRAGAAEARAVPLSRS